MIILYLHGLGSSPASKKAQYYKTAFADVAEVVIPDLNVPTFETLTLTAILAQVAETIRSLPDDQPIALIGSSLGGLTALHFADRYRQHEAARVSHLVLMAPALDFMASRNTPEYAAELAQWRSLGYQDWFHYGYNRPLKLHYGLVEDIQRYDSYAVQLDRPILIYHGLRDESVDYRLSQRYAAERTNVTLHLLESDHQLLDQTALMLDGMRAFLGFAPHHTKPHP